MTPMPWLHTVTGTRLRPVLQATWSLFLLALLYTAPGFRPGYVLAPLDGVNAYAAWNPDPTSLPSISNRTAAVDVVDLFEPWDIQARRALAAAEIPWRNPFAGHGAPLFANPQTALLSPFTWPRLILGDGGWVWCVTLKLIVAGLGMFVLARGLGAPATAAAFSGSLFLCSGFSIVYGFNPITNVFCVLPWLAAGALRVLEAPRPAHLLWLVAAAALATAGGHPETLAFGVTGITLFVASEAVARTPSILAALRRLVWVAAAAASGFLLLGIHLVPFLALLARADSVGIRSSSPPQGFQPSAVLGQLLPGALGGPLAGEISLTGLASAASLGTGFDNGTTLFLGFLTLPVLCLGYTRLSASLRRGLVVGAVSLLFVWRLPPTEAIQRSIPVLSAGVPPYWAAVFVLFASAAAGPALAVVAARPPSVRLGALCVLFGTTLCSAGILATSSALRPTLQSLARPTVTTLHTRGLLRGDPATYLERFDTYWERGRSTAIRRILLPGVIIAAGSVGLIARRRRGLLLGGAILVELLAFGLGWFPAVPRRDIPGEPAAVHDLKILDPERRWFMTAADGVYPPILSTRDGIRDVRQYDQLVDAEFATQLRAGGINDYDAVYPRALSPTQIRRLAAIGVRYFLSREPIEGCARVGGAPPPAVGIYELPNAAPSALPPNGPPAGLEEGIAVSVLAALATVVLLLVAMQRRGAAPTHLPPRPEPTDQGPFVPADCVRESPAGGKREPAPGPTRNAATSRAMSA